MQIETRYEVKDLRKMAASQNPRLKPINCPYLLKVERKIDYYGDSPHCMSSLDYCGTLKEGENVCTARLDDESEIHGRSNETPYCGMRESACIFSKNNGLELICRGGRKMKLEFKSFEKGEKNGS